MLKFSSLIYKIVKGAYTIVPFKKQFCYTIKYLKIPHSLFYKDFKFRGKFKIHISANQSFYLSHYGGTIENETFWNGLFNSFESDTGWIWKELCKCSNTIIDIGANTGIYSMVAKTINPQSKVYAFEPSIHCYNKLVYNNTLNNFDIICEQIALSNINGEQTFYDTPDSNETAASLNPEKLKNWDEYEGDICEYKVNTQTFTNYIENNKISSIDLIKMDIEMHEPEAIAGFGKYLLEYKPIVIIEVLSDAVAEKLNALIDSNDFILFNLFEDGRAERKNTFSVIPWKWNYLFFHKDLEDYIKKNTSLRF